MNRIGRPTLVLSLLLASVPWCLAADQDPDQARAIAEIEKLGGKVVIDEKSSGKPVFRVELCGTQVTDAALEHLKGLPQLKGLSLAGPLVTDASLTYLKGLPQLTWLSLERARVTDAGLVHLKGLTKLRWLSLCGTKVTDAGLTHIKGLNQLQGLHLSGTKVTNAGVKELENALPKVKIER
jgi:hypothetical protein